MWIFCILCTIMITINVQIHFEFAVFTCLVMCLQATLNNPKQHTHTHTHLKYNIYETLACVINSLYRMDPKPSLKNMNDIDH